MGACKIINIKQDINFLEYPLWFQNLRHDGKGFIWRDVEGYEYCSGYMPPDKVDMLFLLYLLRKAQQDGYNHNIVCSRYEILKGCNFPINAQYYERLKESLRRWSSVAIHFEGTFYDGGTYYTKEFHIMKGSINQNTKLLDVMIDLDWLLKIKESKYFRYINFELYKSLKRPLSRRLFELLDKSFLGRNSFFIHLTKLGVKLTITGEEVRTKHETKRVIYASAILKKIIPAINEINRLSQNIEICKKLGLKPEEIFTITYEITGVEQDRIIHFHKHFLIVPEEKKKDENHEKNGDEPVKNELKILLSMLKLSTKKLENIIKLYLKKNGFEYVKWNILYTNKNGTKNYSVYLQKALQENWGEEWAEEEKKKIDSKAKKEEEARLGKEEKMRKDLEKKEGAKQMPLFFEKIEKINPEIKREMWEIAENQISKDITTKRENLVKIIYMNLLWEYLNKHGENFCKGILDNFQAFFCIGKPI